jgi:hypothetical protein
MVYITHYIWSSSENFSKAVDKHRKPFPNRFLQCKKKLCKPDTVVQSATASLQKTVQSVW